MKPRTLDVPIKRKWFDKIVDGKKTIEYRKFGSFWGSRLEGKQYDQIRFRNGYTSDAPEIYTEYRGVRRNFRTSEYEIRIGRILKKKRLRHRS
jgi:hypothetical protein